ncbi:hypothetical protein CRENBAI_006923 [Crenichthys baileyi]|uniref:Uncharacterized protein n=1 Tax=Crenichthys baileyi TaxID=28760 RepID=A0AAV9S669_9TELE
MCGDAVRCQTWTTTKSAEREEECACGCVLKVCTTATGKEVQLAMGKGGSGRTQTNHRYLQYPYRVGRRSSCPPDSLSHLYSSRRRHHRHKPSSSPHSNRASHVSSSPVGLTLVCTRRMLRQIPRWVRLKSFPLDDVFTQHCRHGEVRTGASNPTSVRDHPHCLSAQLLGLILHTLQFTSR